MFNRSGSALVAKTEGNTAKRFYGYMESAVDDKGRILIDKKNRERLGSDFVAAMMPNGCLALYRQEFWEELASSVLDRPESNTGQEHYTRFMFGNVADDLNCDSQGRFVLPQWLRTSAKIEGDIVLHGAGNRLEIWDAAEFKKYEASPFEYGAERRARVDQSKVMMKAEADPGGWE